MWTYQGDKMLKQEDLKKIRASIGYTQQEMANLIYVTLRMYQNYEYCSKLMPRRMVELMHYKLKDLGLLD